MQDVSYTTKRDVEGTRWSTSKETRWISEWHTRWRVNVVESEEDIVEAHEEKYETGNIQEEESEELHDSQE